MPTVKVQKSEWLTLGVAKFSDRGSEGINVEQMARQLNCNKASFYWHFKSKEQFLNEMVISWFENSAQPIIKKVDEQADPGKRFENFLRVSFQDKSRKDFMFYLRQLAQSNNHLQEILDDLTKKRLQITSQLITDLGYSAAESQKKAEILLNFYIGWYEIHKFRTREEKKDIDYAIELIKNFINF